jgi:hypothetical protein
VLILFGQIATTTCLRIQLELILRAKVLTEGALAKVVTGTVAESKILVGLRVLRGVGFCQWFSLLIDFF